MKKIVIAMFAVLSLATVACASAPEPDPAPDGTSGEEDSSDEETATSSEAVTTCGGAYASCGTGKPACCAGTICRTSYGCSYYRCAKSCYPRTY